MRCQLLLTSPLLLFVLGAQQPNTYPALKSPGIDSADHLSDALHLAVPSERERILYRLGVDSETARMAAGQLETALRSERIDGSDASLLSIPCSTTLTTAHLYLLGASMHVTDDAQLNCWRENASYGFLFLPGHPSMAVFAHHSTATHGTGEVADNMLLLEPRGHRWATLLETTEYDRTDLPDKTVEHASTIQPFPDGSLQETRATTVHRGGSENDPAHARIEAVERRRWRWSAATRTYSPDPFTTASR